MKLCTVLGATALFISTVACAAVPPQITAAPAEKRIHKVRPAKALLKVGAAKRDDDDDDDDGSYDDGSNYNNNWDNHSSYTYRSNGRVYTVTMGDGSWSGNHDYLTDDLLDMLPEATDVDTLSSLSRVYQSITQDPTLSGWVNQPSVSRAIASASRAANTLGRIHDHDGNPFDERSGALGAASPAMGVAMAMAAAAAGAVIVML